jgi:LuxR family transcriptional regulator, maltose regulon positive regulatory protein
LLEEVVNQLPEQTQSFLLYTSILERISAPLCDAILKRADSAAMLDQLEQGNLFLTALDDESTPGSEADWYRYHHLFRDFLHTWLNRTQPERARALHRAAAGWLAEHGSLNEAAYHAFRCGDWSFAADFVEQHGFALIVLSEIATIYEWCDAFPEAVLRSRPTLCVFQALALAYRFQGKQRSRVEARLQQAKEALSALPSPDQKLAVEELSAVVQTFLAMIPDARADAHQQLELAQTHLNGYPPGDPGRFPWLLITGYAYLALTQPEAAKAMFEQALPLARQAGLYFGMVEVTFHLALLAYSQGQLDSALEICQKMQDELAAILQPSGLALPALGCLEVAAGCVLLEQDHLEEAEQRLRHGLDLMGWGMNPYYLMTAYLALFRLYAIQGKMAEAWSCLDSLDTLWPDLHLITQGYRIQAELRSHRDDPRVVERARDWMRRCQSSMGAPLQAAGLGPIGSEEAFYQANLIWSRMQLVLNPIQHIPTHLDFQVKHARENGLVSRDIELTLLHAEMVYQQGDEELALAALEQALRIGLAAGYVRVFDQSTGLDQLLHLARKRGIYPAGVDEILFAIRATRGREGDAVFDAKPVQECLKGMKMGELVEPLSERELEVLRMIASGANNQAIAERFVITVGTVKSHIHHIFGKLDARNRTDAVARARKNGLIP